MASMGSLSLDILLPAGNPSLGDWALQAQPNATKPGDTTDESDSDDSTFHTRVLSANGGPVNALGAPHCGGIYLAATPASNTRASDDKIQALPVVTQVLHESAPEQSAPVNAADTGLYDAVPAALFSSPLPTAQTRQLGRLAIVDGARRTVGGPGSGNPLTMGAVPPGAKTARKWATVPDKMALLHLVNTHLRAGRPDYARIAHACGGDAKGFELPGSNRRLTIGAYRSMVSKFFIQKNGGYAYNLHWRKAGK